MAGAAMRKILETCLADAADLVFIFGDFIYLIYKKIMAIPAPTLTEFILWCILFLGVW